MELDAVGGCGLLLAADLHRAGLTFPEQPSERLIATEGFAVLARARGIGSFGLPQVQVIHA